MNVKQRSFYLASLFLAAVFISLPISAIAFSRGPDTEIGVTEYVGSLLLAAAVIGVIYNLWRTTRAYGGIIGAGLRWIGVGIIFLTVEALDRVAVNLAGQGIVVGFTGLVYESIAHDALILLGLFFLTVGFVKLTSAAKN